MPYYALATPRSQLKARPVLPTMAWPFYGQGDYHWTITNYENYVNEGYSRNAIIYAAIAYKQRAISQAPLRPYTGTFQQPEMVDLDHPAWKWCLRPNEDQSFIEFMQQALCFLNLSGNNYTFIDRNPDGSVRALYNMRPDWVELMFRRDDQKFMGYLYRPTGVSKEKGLPLLPTDVMHIKYPNPIDPYEGRGYGMSPIMPLAQPAEVDNAVTKFLYQYFRTGIASMGAIVTDKVVNKADREVYRRQWMEMYGGAENWSKPMFLDEGKKWQPFTPPFKDLDFQIVDKRDEARILSPLGVNGVLLGLPGAMERSTFNNMKEIKADFWETTFGPELQLFEVEYIYYLTTKDGVFPMFDTSDVPALKRDIPPLVVAFAQLVQVGVPPTIAAKTVSLPMERWAGDEISRVPLSLQPAGTPPPAPTQPTPQPAEEETPEPEESPPGQEEIEEEREEDAAPAELIHLDWTPEQKAVIWKAQDAMAQSWQGAFGEAAVAQFKRDHAEIAAILNDTARKARTRKTPVQWMDALPSVKDWMQAAGEAQWRSTFYPLQVGLIGDVQNFWSVEMGLAFDILPVEGMAWFQDYTLKFAQPIGETTLSDVHNVIQQGQAEGWSHPTMMKHMQTVFDQYMAGNLSPEDFEWFTSRMPAYRRELISRTETNRLSSAGSYNLFRDWSVQEKEWLATMDNRVREAHAAMNGQVRPVNEPFESPSGGRLMYPGDPASPVDGFNCRCALLPRIPKGLAAVIPLKIKALEDKYGSPDWQHVQLD